MDCEMPVLNGYEASLKIREDENDRGVETNKVIIVGLSGNQGDGHLRKCK